MKTAEQQKRDNQVTKEARNFTAANDGTDKWALSPVGWWGLKDGTPLGTLEFKKGLWSVVFADGEAGGRFKTLSAAMNQFGHYGKWLRTESVDLLKSNEIAAIETFATGIVCNADGGDADNSGSIIAVGPWHKLPGYNHSKRTILVAHTNGKYKVHEQFGDMNKISGGIDGRIYGGFFRYKSTKLVDAVKLFAATVQREARDMKAMVEPTIVHEGEIEQRRGGKAGILGAALAK